MIKDRLLMTLVLISFSILGYAQGEIAIDTTFSVGMQNNPSIAEVNAYNDDLTNYWTGNPDTDDEVSITFDLACSHELTEMGINFWKADERTTVFSIDVAENADGPYTNVLLNQVSSADTGITVQTEQFFDLSGNTARFVKFIGVGNSSSSNWTSIANVNIYGIDAGCQGTISSVSNTLLLDQGVKIFPIPTNDGLLTISSDEKELNQIEVFNAVGQRVLTTNGNNSLSKQLDVSELAKGAYFIQIEGLGQTKFILN